jgi:hypothetical protein
VGGSGFAQSSPRLVSKNRAYCRFIPSSPRCADAQFTEKLRQAEVRRAAGPIGRGRRAIRDIAHPGQCLFAGFMPCLHGDGSHHWRQFSAHLSSHRMWPATKRGQMSAITSSDLSVCPGPEQPRTHARSFSPREYGDLARADRLPVPCIPSSPAKTWHRSVIRRLERKPRKRPDDGGLESLHAAASWAL